MTRPAPWPGVFFERCPISSGAVERCGSGPETVVEFRAWVPQPLGIVAVNFASTDLLRTTLAPLRPAGAVVVVVDNWSGEAERAAITGLSAEQGWELVALPDNRGFGAGVNAGVARARALQCAALLLLNPDAEIGDDVAAELGRACLDAPLTFVAPQIVDAAGRVTSAGSSLDLIDGRVRSAAGAAQDPRPGRRRVPWLTAACLALSVELWDRVGGFDESYFMYWEDVDFSYRCLEAGATPVVREDLTVLHDQGGTQGPRAGRAKSALYYYYNARNRMLFAAKHLDRRGVWRWCWRTPKVSWEILMRGGRRQLLHSPGRGTAAARGAVSGLAIGLRALLARRRRAD